MASWRLSTRGKADLVGIYADGILRFGKSHARKYRDELERTFDTLSSAPLLGREHVGATKSVRVHFHQAHVVAYASEPRGIVIVRLLPARADWKEHL